jgi:Group II intron, maturase-specific domain
VKPLALRGLLLPAFVQGLAYLSLKAVRVTPRMKALTVLLRKLKDVFRHHTSQPVDRVIYLINPILRGWASGAIRYRARPRLHWLVELTIYHFKNKL